ncbi:MAG TPA: PAS domain S-box protein [Acidobacteriaceae bacterium]|jgi:PAS domain S-box-containing protein|nr:PAS domain S-box protein [Acidobacteriaceae bacterium]
MRDRLQALFEGVETGIMVIDPETHRIVDANPVALSLVGLPAEKIVGAVCHRFVCPAETGRCPVTDLGQTVDNSERVLLTVSGEKRAIIKTVRPVVIAGRSYLLESFLDITDRKRAEQSLAEHTAYLNTLVEVSPMGIAVLDEAGRVRLSNTALERLFLYSHQDLDGAFLHDLVVPEEMDRDSRGHMSACLAGQSVHFTTRRRRHDGALLEVEIYAVPLDVPGEPREVLALYHDITERRQIEAEMEERHRLATLAGEIGIALTGAESLERGLQSCAEVLIRHMHLACVRIWTLSEQEGGLRLQAAAGTLSGDDDARLRDAFEITRIAAGGDPQFISLSGHALCFGDPDCPGGAHLASLAVCPLKVSEDVLGVVAAFSRTSLTDAARQTFISVAHNIAQFVERKRGEASLRESEDRFRTAFEDAPYGMCMVALDGRFLHANAALCQMLGYSQGDLLSGAWPKITHPDDLQRSRQAQMRFTLGEVRTVEMEKRYIRKDGQVLWARVRILAAQDNGGHLSHYITQVEDVTLRKLAEDRLRASEERYRELFENASDLVYTFDLDLHITSINRLAEQTMGYSREEATRMNLCHLVEAAQCESIRVLVNRMVAGAAPAKIEFDIRTKDDRRVTLEVSPRLIYRDGNAVGIQAIARDITGRDLAEMELRQAQKLESVGRLASGIAHEINTPLQFVGDNVRFLQDSFQQIQELLSALRAFCGQSGPAFAAELRQLEEKLDTGYLVREIPEALAQTREGVERVVTIVRAMKEFAHPDSRDHVRADLNKALLNTLAVARNELKYVADVETDFGELPMVVCSVSDLNQVFLNLLVNAAHAIADVFQHTGQKGKIRVRTEAQGNQVLIAIADNGAGIPEGIRDRIFDPFFTTKEVGRGTGQGLAIARAVVDRHKGSLTFQSEVGRGTTFFISLPVENS